MEQAADLGYFRFTRRDGFNIWHFSRALLGARIVEGPMMLPLAADLARHNDRERLRRIAERIEEPPSVHRNDDDSAAVNTGEGTLWDTAKPLPLPK